jgi:hypothetical protein
MISTLTLSIANPGYALASSLNPVNGPKAMFSPGTPTPWQQFEQGCVADVLSCGTTQALTGSPLPSLSYEPSLTQALGLGSLFPQSWGQLQANQYHDPVFSAKGHNSKLLGDFAWASPLTGDEFLRLAKGFDRYGQNGGQAWGAEAAQWLGNVTGVSVVDGIVYVEESNDKLFALDALTGIPVWSITTVNSNMGDALVENVGGKPIVYVAAGDVGFTLNHALDYGSLNSSTPQPAVRGANYSAVYAIDGTTGKVIWRVDTPGEAMPTPVYANNSIFPPPETAICGLSMHRPEP